MLRKRSEDVQLKASVLERPDYTSADAHALRALQAGNASPHQQQRALNYVVNVLCGTYDMPYRPEARDTDFALGKMKVGQDIVWLLNTAKTKPPRGEDLAEDQ